MRKPFALLAALLLLAFRSPAFASPACGSDTSPDPIAAMGKDVWLNGYCNAFLPCRLVLEQFRACQAAEGFLSDLGAKEGEPLTTDHVERALASSGNENSVSACLWNFDANACRNYLGGSNGSDTQAPAAGAPERAAIGSQAPPSRQAMSQTVAELARQQLRDRDANAHTAVGVIERECKAGAEACRATLEQMVDPVLREAEELNANPEYLAHLPAHTPGTLEYANRLGWTRQNGQWTFAAGAGSSNTLRDYLLSADECRKLHEQLGNDIQAKPTQEPSDLSFFEGECLPQMPAAAADLQKWRAGFASTGVAATSGPETKQNDQPASSEPEAAAGTAAALDQWNGSVLEGEEQEVAYDPANLVFKREFAGGCHMYEFDAGPDDSLVGVNWSGRCEAGRPLNGRGRVEWVSSNLDSQRDPGKEHDRFSQEGTMVQGRWRGTVVWSAYIPWNPTDSQTQGGTIVFDELGCARDESDPEDRGGMYALCRESQAAYGTGGAAAGRQGL